MCRYQEYSDEALIQRLRLGESSIEDYLMEKYKNLVKAKARAMFMIGGDTDDLIQEGMIGLFKAIRDYDLEETTSFATFARLCIDRQLYKAIEASNRLKHQPLNSYVSFSDLTKEEDLVHNWGESPETIVLEKARMDDLMKNLRKACSPFENHVMDLYIKGYDYRKIAEMMDKPPKSIDNALQRIRIKMKVKDDTEEE